MKNLLLTTCLFIGTSLAPAMAYTQDQDSDRSHPTTYVKDSVITTKVKTMLAADKMSSLVHVQVDTDAKGAVVLSGTVRTHDQADKAVSIARAVEGVTSVKSNLQVKKDD